MFEDFTLEWINVGEDCQHAIHDPQTVKAMVEDYRAGLGIDRG